MTDFTRSFETVIDAPVHAVFEYCRDPRDLFQGWPELQVTEVVMPRDGVGTRAHIVGRFAWLFEAVDGGTKLTMVVLEEDLHWWQNLVESVSAGVLAKKMRSMLAAIKTGVESQTSRAA